MNKLQENEPGWMLVTGGGCADIGKGTLAAMLGRSLALSGVETGYQKLEPCLQREIERLPNTAFGEIVRHTDGFSYDADVSRAAFYIPDFTPHPRADLSLGELLADFLQSPGTNGGSPRLIEAGQSLRRLFDSCAECTVVELGGTAGEREHSLLLDMLLTHVGSPSLHLHLTTTFDRPGGGETTKPLQTSLDALSIPPDFVLVRSTIGETSLAKKLRSSGTRANVRVVPDDPVWPARAYAEAVSELSLPGVTDQAFAPAEVCDEPDASIGIVCDSGGRSGYSSLLERIRAWSGGRARTRLLQPHDDWRGVDAAIRIGERSPPALPPDFDGPSLEIVPTEHGHDARDHSRRADWHGTADAPAGPLWNWLNDWLLEPED